MKQIINLEETIGYDSFFNTNPEQIDNNPTEMNNLYLFLLRILFFIDQCHDFAENADRNKFFDGKNKDEVKQIKNKIIKNLHDMLYLDFMYIIKPCPPAPEDVGDILELPTCTHSDIKIGISDFNEYNINIVNQYLSKINLEIYKPRVKLFCEKMFNEESKQMGKNEWNELYTNFNINTNMLDCLNNVIQYSFSDRKYKICLLILDGFFNINKFNVGSEVSKKNPNMTGFDCTKNWEELRYILSLNRKLVSKTKYTGIDVFVDADKSRYNISPISSYACSSLRNQVPIKYKSTLATEFDGATKPVLESLLQVLGAKSSEIIDNYNKDYNAGLNIIISFFNKPIIQYKYNMVPIVKDLSSINTLTELKKTYTIIKDELSTLPELSQSNIKDIFINHDLPVVSNLNLDVNFGYKNKLESLIKYIQEYNITIYNKIIEKLTINKIQLDIQFFSYKSENYILDKSHNLRSVSDITNFIILNNPNLENLHYFNNWSYFNIINYKTAGDLGQILASCIYAKTNPDKLVYFITFDRICSNISSLFNYGTIFESGSNVLYPLDVFSYNSFFPLSYYVETLYSYDEIHDHNVAQFGRYKNKQLRISNYSKNKNNKVKNKNNKVKNKNNKSTKIKKLYKEAFKLGLPKSVLKLEFKKLEEKIKKMKKLAIKYRLKLNNKLISNIKTSIKIHKKAKKYKINVTKRTKSGKRIYKTPNELLKEIKNHKRK
jgi:hypothetical protein